MCNTPGHLKSLRKIMPGASVNCFFGCGLQQSRDHKCDNAYTLFLAK